MGDLGRALPRGELGLAGGRRVALREDEVSVRKPRYDAFYGTSLEHTLRVWGIDTLVICGTVANICVHYTASAPP